MVSVPDIGAALPVALLPDEQAASPAASVSSAVTAARFFISPPGSALAVEGAGAAPVPALVVEYRRSRRPTSVVRSPVPGDGRAKGGGGPALRSRRVYRDLKPSHAVLTHDSACTARMAPGRPRPASPGQVQMPPGHAGGAL